MADNVQLQGLEFVVKAETKNAESGLSKLANSLSRIKSATKSGLGLDKAIRELQEFNASIDEMDTTAVESMANALNSIKTAGRWLNTVRSQLTAIAAIDFSNITQVSDAIGLMTSKVGGAGSAAASAAKPIVDNDVVTPAATEHIEGSTVQVKEAGKALGEVAGKAEEASKSVDKVGNSAKGAGEKFKNAIEGIKNFLSSIKRILMYRAIRFILKEISEGFQEGVQNVVKWEMATGRAANLNSANAALSAYASTFEKLKNSIGAMAIPALQAFLPVVQTVTGWLIKLANLLNQLFAALNGQKTWIRAKDVQVNYADSLDKTTSAAKKLKSAMTGFDELNVINDSNSGGGGSGGSGSFTDMFEEVPLDDWAQWVSNNKELTLGLAGLIGLIGLLTKFLPGLIGLFRKKTKHLATKRMQRKRKPLR